MPKDRKHLTPNEREGVIKDYVSGMKFAAIMAKWDIEDSTIARLMRRRGIPLRGPGRPRRKPQ